MTLAVVWLSGMAAGRAGRYTELSVDNNQDTVKRLTGISRDLWKGKVALRSKGKGTVSHTKVFTRDQRCTWEPDYQLRL